MLGERVASHFEVTRAMLQDSPCGGGCPATRPKHIAIRVMLWDWGYGKTLLPIPSGL